MAILIPGKLCYLGNPRTASTAVHAALQKDVEHGVAVRSHGQHLTLEEVPGYAGELAFTTVRNPYDVLVTWWTKVRRTGEWSGGFVQFLREYENRDFERGGRLFFCCTEGVEVTRYEDLQNEFDAVRARVGLPPRRLDVLNPSGVRKGPWRTYYSSDEIRAANNRFGHEADRWGYERLG